MRHVPFALVGLVALAAATPLSGQQAETSPSFSLASSHTFTTREHPSILLTYRGVDHLDFRIYRVHDPFAFFAKLRDPHQLGSEEPIVPQERTWLERIAFWKAARRADIRMLLRRQVSAAYLARRHAEADAQQVVQRRTTSVNTFAQVPLLNRAQLVTSWRELVPRVRDAEARRVPLDIPAAGIYVVEAVSAPLRAYTVVVVSDVGLVTKTAPGQLVLFAANRFSGQPAPGCRVGVLADQRTIASGQTEADGTFDAVIAGTEPEHLVTIAQCGSQVSATDPLAFSLREPARDLVGYTYTDKPVYRPGHTVRFKSVLRWRERGALVAFGRDPVEVAIAAADDKIVFREKRPVDEFGALNGTYTIPMTAGLGYYTIRVTSGDRTATGSFEVQEYRKPEYDVSVRPPAKLALQGSNVTATIVARYYFGQPVAGASVKYVVHTQPYYSPMRDESSGEGEEGGGGWYGGEQQLEGTAQLDQQGTATVSIPLALDEHGRDYTARIEARVTDASGREVSGAASVNATYGTFMVVARTERYVYTTGATASLSLRTVDYDGNPRPTVPVRVAVEQVDYSRGYDNPVVTRISDGTTQTDADGRASWTFSVPARPGSYRIRATSQSEGRTLSGDAYIWVPGRTDRSVDEGDQFLELVADRRAYAPGDTARIVVRGAEFDTSVLVTKEHQQVAAHRVIRLRGNESFDLPIAADDVGDIYVSVAFLKDDRLYRAERRLTVPATMRQLSVTASSDRPVARPGQPGVFTLHVVDAEGRPARAQLSVGLVDEAVYGVRPDTTPDPLRFFYRREYNMVATALSRDYPFVGYSGTDQLLLARRRRPLTLADFKADRPDRPRVRKDFPDTIFWVADATTDTSGNAQVRVEYPDSLTSWRLTVRAVTVTTDVGTATAHTTTTKDLILRVVTPRFLSEGDEVAIPTIVHNYLPETKSVSVSFAAAGLTPIDQGEPAARSLNVAANGQQRTDWRFKAERPQPITVTGTATTDVEGDAVKLTLPVLPAGLQRDTGNSGSIVGGGERTMTLTVPPTAGASSRSIRVKLAPSLAGAMLGALDYLNSYPYGCTEQTLSSFVPNLVVLRALQQMSLAPAERLASLDRQVADGLKRLYDYQHQDGGWGWWKTDKNHPFMTAYALDGLAAARDNGVDIDQWRLAQAGRALRQLYVKYPRAIPDLKAYVVYALVRSGAETDPDEPFVLAQAVNDLWAARTRMTASGRALLLMTLDRQKDARADTSARELMALAQTRGELTWWPVANDPLLDDFVDTSAEATALALRALASRQAREPLLENAARWLVLNRGAGAYWVSTKQTALALEGLLEYMRVRGERAAPTTADVFVNGTPAGSHTFDAAALTAAEPVTLTAPAAEGTNTVRVVARGQGSLYFTASARYYDKPAATARTGSRHLALVRSYFALTPVEKNGRIVYRESPFTGTARPGDLLLVRLTAAGSTDWRYLMLEDPLPAGAEAVERDEAYQLERRRTGWFFSQRELRDDRAVFFLEDFTAGRYEFSYLLKVTTPGVFTAMPARIGPMYVPDEAASSGVQPVTVSPEGIK